MQPSIAELRVGAVVDDLVGAVADARLRVAEQPHAAEVADAGEQVEEALRRLLARRRPDAVRLLTEAGERGERLDRDRRRSPREKTPRRCSRSGRRPAGRSCAAGTA